MRPRSVRSRRRRLREAPSRPAAAPWAVVACLLAGLVAAPGCGERPSSTGPGAGPGGGAETTSTARPQVTAEPPPRPASPAELAILAPAAAGGKLADWTIRAIHGVEQGTLEIVCEKDGARVVLSVALAADGGPEPPVSTERYAVFYSSRGATAEDGERLAKALAELLHANRAAPPPPGLGPFVPRARTL